MQEQAPGVRGLIWQLSGQISSGSEKWGEGKELGLQGQSLHVAPIFQAAASLPGGAAHKLPHALPPYLTEVECYLWYKSHF